MALIVGMTGKLIGASYDNLLNVFLQNKDLKANCWRNLSNKYIIVYVDLNLLFYFTGYQEAALLPFYSTIFLVQLFYIATGIYFEILKRYLYSFMEKGFSLKKNLFYWKYFLLYFFPLYDIL